MYWGDSLHICAYTCHFRFKLEKYGSDCFLFSQQRQVTADEFVDTKTGCEVKEL